METSKVFKKDNKWMYKVIVTEGNSTITIEGIVTDASELPPITNPVPIPVIINIDNTDPSVVYTGDWLHIANQPWNAPFLNKSASVSYVVGATVRTQFVGNKIEWWTEKRENHAIVAMKVDDQVEELVDLYAARNDNNCLKVWEKTLKDGNHTITIRLTDKKNPAATEINMVHDHFKVYK